MAKAAVVGLGAMASWMAHWLVDASHAVTLEPHAREGRIR